MDSACYFAHLTDEMLSAPRSADQRSHSFACAISSLHALLHMRTFSESGPQYFCVREGLSTLQPWAETTLMSAGILSPPFTSIRSPATTSSALICTFSPSRITKACCTEILDLIKKRNKQTTWIVFCWSLVHTAYLRNHVLERLHNFGALGLLEVWEATGNDDDSCEHNT